MEKYRVDGQIFESLDDAERYQRNLSASMPDDYIVTIYKAETGYDPNPNKTEWVPIN